MLKKAMYFLFSLSFLTVFNGYADEVAVESNDVEVSSNDVEAEVAGNVECNDACDKEDCKE